MTFSALTRLCAGLVVVLTMTFPSLAGSNDLMPAPGTSLEHSHQHDAEPVYVCPMHPQIQSDQPGSCPICGMNLVPRQTDAGISAASSSKHTHQHEAKPIYVCPMHPQVQSDQPGSCPICGMNLVLRQADDDAAASSPTATNTDDHPPVTLSGTVIQNLGVRTAQVARETLNQSIRTLGRVTYDETRLAHLHPRAAGWIEGLSLRAEGEPVKQGQELAALYAPDILSAQVDFLIATEPQSSGERRIKADQARNLLRLLDVPEAVIRDIERTRATRNTVPVLAPMDGIVTRLMAREGMYVTPDSEMFAIADLSAVWVLADVFEHQLAWIKPGLKAEMSVPAWPGRTWEGRVDYLYPELDPKTRTLRVRLVFPNPGLDLRPNLFANVTIQGDPGTARLTIPREALIQTGQRASVIRALGDGRFQPVDVTVGMAADERVEILAGLDEGDEILVSGQFLIDSESSLQASFQRLSDPAAVTGQRH